MVLPATAISGIILQTNLYLKLFSESSAGRRIAAFPVEYKDSLAKK